MSRNARISGRAIALQLPDLSSFTHPRYAALADAIRSLVLDGRIPLGTQLPSERELALSVQCSRATVTTAYDRLRELGYLVSRTGAGSFAALPAGSGSAPVTPIGLYRGTPIPGVDSPILDLTCAAPSGFPDLINRAVQGAAAMLPHALSGLGYDPIGLPALRVAVANRLTERGVPTTPDQILITNGALHAFDLILRLLVGPGDRVLAELPTYSGALDAIRGSGARLVTASMDLDGGWRAGRVASTIRQLAPQLAYLIPDFHNPTGILVPAADRADVLRAARSAGTVVVIDESCVELGFVPAVEPTAARDASVITIGSLTKVVWGGLRVGWVRASPELIARLAARRASSDIAGPVLDQMVAAELFTDLDEFVSRRRAQLLANRDALLEAVAVHLPDWRIRPPQGGLSAWAELPVPAATALALLADSVGVQLVSGSRFGVEGTLERFIRLPYTLGPDDLREAVRRLVPIWAQASRHTSTATLRASAPLIVA
jgi:DNA-binding transcriptional MocR family regulator